MRRRDFVALMTGTVATWPLVARAQESDRTYRLGFLILATRASPAVAAFFDERPKPSWPRLMLRRRFCLSTACDEHSELVSCSFQ
jgi:hypothetical protein